MACKYTIKLRGGEVIEIPSSLLSKEDYTRKELFDSLSKLSVDKLFKISDKINESTNAPLKTSLLDLGDVIKTTSLNDIRKDKLNVTKENDISISLKSVAEQLIDTLESLGEDVNFHSIIYTDLYKNFTPNYGNAYDLKNNTFVINSDEVGNVQFIPLIKGLIDMYILKYDSNIRNIIASQTEDVNSFISNMPYLFRKGKITKDIETAIKKSLNINNEMFEYIYSLHSSNAEKNLSEYTGKSSSDIHNFAENIYLKFNNLFREKDFYYGNTEQLDIYPNLAPGDLIKFKVPNFNNGQFGIYLNHFNSGNKRHYVILKINPKGEGYRYETLSEDQLKFRNSETNKDEFVIKRNITSEYTELPEASKLPPPNSIPPKDKFILDSSKGRIGTDIIKSLKPGDRYKRIYESKDGLKENIEEVVEIRNNVLISRSPNLKYPKINKRYINSIQVEVIEFDLRNHPEFRDFNAIESRQNSKKSTYKVEFKDTNNIEQLLNIISQGDVVLSKMPNGTGYFYNYYLGEIDDDKIVILRKNDQGSLAPLTISKSEITGVIYDLSKYEDIINSYDIENAKKSLNILNNDFSASMIVGESNSKIDPYKRYSSYDLSNSTKSAYNLKNSIKAGDYVVILGTPYLVLEKLNGDLKLYSDSFSIKNIEEVEHLIRPVFEPNAYTEKALMMNTPLISSASDLEETFNLDKVALTEMKYVISNIYDNNYEWENGGVKQGYWVDIDLFNSRSHKLIDLTSKWSELNLSKGVDPYSVKLNKVITTNTSNTSRFEIRSMKVADILANISVGSYISLENMYKIFRVEEVSNDGLYVSYTYKDKNGDVLSTSKFISKEALTDTSSSEYENTIFKLYIPIVHTNTIKKFKDHKVTVPKKIIPRIEADNSAEFIKMMTESLATFLADNFGVNIHLMSSDELKSDDNIELQINVKHLDTAKAFIYKDEIYINSDLASIEDPIHEILHLILGTFKANNPELYKSMVTKMELNIYKPIYDSIKNNYPNNTHYELLEETFVKVFSENLSHKLDSKELDDVSFIDSINKTVNDIFQFETESEDLYKNFNTPLIDLLNEFGSNFIKNPESMYDSTASSNSNKVTILKRSLLEQAKLKEVCQ